MSLQGSQMACEMLSPDSEFGPGPEFQSSEQIWRSPVVEANPFLPNTGLKTHVVGCLSFPEGGLLSLHSVNFASQLAGKPCLWGFSSGAVSPEPVAEVGYLHLQGKAKPHPHVFALQESPVSLNLLGTFLAPTVTHSVCKPAYPT